jgi:hypothetical protein
MSKYFIPTTLKQYRINDIFYSDTGRLTIILWGTSFQPKITYVDIHTNRHIELMSTICQHSHASIYTLETIIHDRPSDIQLVINNDSVHVHVNNYPQFPGEIIMSTLVKNEDNYLKQWIDYHLRLGITRFVIYDNAQTMYLDTILSEYIEKEIVILIKWSYQYHIEKAQFTQQDHSIYAFQKSKYIGLMDIDEYVNIQKKIKIDDFFNELIAHNYHHHYSGFQLLNKLFYNPEKLPTHDLHFFQCFECDHTTIGFRQKCFVIPTRVKSFSVHTVTDGSTLYEVAEKDAFFNHYFFLNKRGRGENQTGITDNSILLHLQ